MPTLTTRVETPKNADCAIAPEEGTPSINEKVRLYARVGQALIEPRSSGGDVFAAIEAVLPWPKFKSTVAEAQTLAQPERI